MVCRVAFSARAWSTLIPSRPATRLARTRGSQSIHVLTDGSPSWWAIQPPRRDSMTTSPLRARAASRVSSSTSISGCSAAYVPNVASVMPRSAAIERNTSPPGNSSTARAWATRLDAVVVPEPGGPETVISNREGAVPGSGRERFEESLALLLAEAPHAAHIGDADVFHGATGPDLADTGKRLEHSEDLHLAHRVVRVGLLEKLAQGKRPHLELLLQLGPGAAGLRGLRQCGFPLLGGEIGRLRHERAP